ncbi:MAG: hypothetical protein HYS81_04560 [Candidatus Aenigmatarchaeota archaeon]|nr:MAG: hypothetical protein HYS81_04560 [Candidatus Aenigmarchaeota archaeon]
MDKEITQIVFLGNPYHMERIRYLLRKRIPQKVYFIEAEENNHREEAKEMAEKMRSELEGNLPRWVVEKSEFTAVPFFDFTSAFMKLISIMHNEIRQDRDVLVNAHGGSVIVTTAALLAANATGAKVCWVEPESWGFVEMGGHVSHMAKGAKGIKEVAIPISLGVPEGVDASVLGHIYSRGGTVKGRLSAITEDVGLDKLGANVKKSSSGVVKLSKTLGRLRAKGLIETRKLGRKSFEIKLTKDKGEVVGKVVSLVLEKSI